MKRYGRISEDSQIDLVDTITRYVRYGFTQTILCRMIGISVSFYHKIKSELDKGTVKAEKLPRVGYNINAILPDEEQAVIAYAKANPNYYHRELTWRMVDEKITFMGITTVYRILSKNGLICPNKLRKKYGWHHRYSNEAHSPDERWQTDITYLKYQDRDIYQLSFIDVYSRFVVISVTLLNMESRTVSDVIEAYLKEHQGELKRIPIIQSDNGSPYIGHEFKGVMRDFEVDHVYCNPATPTENVIIERWHRTFKERLYEDDEPQGFEEFKELIQAAVHYYNYDRYHQSLGYVTPYDYYRGEPAKIFTERKKYCKIVRDERRLRNSERMKSFSIQTST